MCATLLDSNPHGLDLASQTPRSFLCPVMVNRKAELDELSRTFDEAAAGRPQAVLIEGEAGIGKSRLCRSLIEAIECRPAAIINFHASEQDVHVPFAPLAHGFRTVLRKLQEGGARIEEVLGSSVSLLAPLAPEIQQLATATAGPARLAPSSTASREAPDGAVRQRQMFDALLFTFSALAALDCRPSAGAGSRVLLVCFEDIHWADESTLDFLRYVVHRYLRPSHDDIPFPIMLVCTYRTECVALRPPLVHFVRTCTEQRLARRLSVPPLSSSDHLTLIEEILGGSADAQLAATLFAHSEGNPFVAEELLGNLFAAGLLRGVEGRWMHQRREGLQVPATLRSVVLERLAGVSAETQGILQAASVIGRAFEFGLLQRITGVGEARLLAALREAISAGLVEEQLPEQSALPGVAPAIWEDEDRFRFRHALTHDVIEADLLMRERRILHGRIADELEGSLLAGSVDDCWRGDVELDASLGPMVGRVAHHLTRAGQPARSRPYALAAAEWAVTVGGWSEAANFLEYALAATAAEDESRVDLLERLGHLWLLRQETPRAATYLEGARDASASNGLLDHAAAIELDLAIVQWFSDSRSVKASLLAVRARAERRWNMGVSANADAVHLCAGAALAAAYASGAGDHAADAISWAERALDMSTDLSNLSRHSRCLAFLARGVARMTAGRTAEGIDDLEHALTTSTGNPLDLYRRMVAHNALVSALHHLGEDQRALDHYLSGLDDPNGLHLAPAALFALQTQGRWREGLEAGEACAARCRKLGLMAATALVDAACGHLLVSMGRPEEGLQKLESAWEYLRSSQDQVWMVSCLWGLGRAYHALRREQEAEAAFNSLYDHAAQAQDRSALALPLMDGCSLFVGHGDLEKAGRWLAELQDVAGRTGNLVARAAALEAAAAVAVAEADGDSAMAALETALGTWKELSRPYDVARCQLRLAEAMLAAPALRIKYRTEADALLAEAEAAFRELGAAADESGAAEVRRKSGMISPARRRRTAPAGREAAGGLTARERDVLELLVAGSTNREIASALFIAESTAELHVSRVLGKLGCSTRGQAAVYAVSQGWCAQPYPERAAS